MLAGNVLDEYIISTTPNNFVSTIDMDTTVTRDGISTNRAFVMERSSVILFLKHIVSCNPLKETFNFAQSLSKFSAHMLLHSSDYLTVNVVCIMASALQVFAVEGITRSIFFYLDLSSLDSLLHVFQATSELQGFLQDSALWTELSILHFKGQRDLELRFLALPTRDRGWEWTVRERTCVELQEFLQSMDERTQFDGTVKILEGDIGYINGIDGQPLDGIAFPTNSHLTNHYVGAAQAVFRRAGRGLTDHVNDPSFRGRRPTGSAVVTPAFDAGVEKLIHCVGPRITMPNCFELLATTYENAMSAILHEELSCVTMASISTGNMGVPCDEGAQVALRTIQKFLRANHWDGKLAIVCYDEPVLNAFAKQKQAVLDRFNETLDLPVVTQDNLPRWPF